MKEALADYARELGFDLCRIAKASGARHAEAFRRWLSDGCHGSMDWLQRNHERRTDPQKVLAGARSIVVVALNYFQGRDPARPGEGRIAHYAQGEDYHGLMMERLERLAAFLAGRGGAQRCYVDTGPVLERDFAADAGVGWHGKSTMLINPGLGTWFFLGEILTTLDLEPDEPARDHCGRCLRCIDACPTGAITGPHRLDARRCISYLTIELKESIPIGLRPLVGDRIYGCDDCLVACPWNRFAHESNEAAFAATPATKGVALCEYLALDEAAFRTQFLRSPIRRIKRRGFLRNVCVALGNVGSREDLPALYRAATDPEPLIAEHAQWAIDRILRRTADEEHAVSASADSHTA